MSHDYQEIADGLYWVEHIASTQDAVTGWDRGALATGYQSAGRGRRGRNWQAAPGTSIALSTVCSRAGLADENLGWMTLAAAVGVVKAMRRHQIPAEIKWPNDVLVHGRKLAGILATFANDRVTIGIGLNRDFAGDPPVETAAGLAEFAQEFETMSPQQLAIFAQDAVQSGVREFISVFSTDPQAGIAEVKKYMATIGQDVKVMLDDEDRFGTAVDLAHNGSLIVRGETEFAVAAGDVVHLRRTNG